MSTFITTDGLQLDEDLAVFYSKYTMTGSYGAGEVKLEKVEDGQVSGVERIFQPDADLSLRGRSQIEDLTEL